MGVFRSFNACRHTSVLQRLDRRRRSVGSTQAATALGSLPLPSAGEGWGEGESPSAGRRTFACSVAPRKSESAKRESTTEKERVVAPFRTRGIGPAWRGGRIRSEGTTPFAHASSWRGRGRTE